MLIEKSYYVYIMTNEHHTTLYTGVTNNLHRRIHEHKSGKGSKFVKKYNLYKLVFFEVLFYARAAIERKKQIKVGSRISKIDLIESINPELKDLFIEI